MRRVRESLTVELWTARSTSSTRSMARPKPSVRIAAAAVAVALLAAGCGSGGSEETDALGSETSAVATDTSTADDVAVVEDDRGDDYDEGLQDDSATASDYELDPIPDTNSGEAVAALVEDIHGPTDDLGRELNRLTFFPTIPTPDGTVLNEIEAATGKISGDDRSSHSFAVEATVGEQPQTVQDRFEQHLVGDGWNLDSTDFDPDRLIEEPHERRTYRRPAESGDFAEESIMVTTIETEPVGLNLRFRSPSVGDEFHLRFQGLAGDDAPIPDGGELRNTFLSTTYGPGLTTLGAISEYHYDNAGSPSAESLLGLIEDQAASGPYEVEFVQNNRVQLVVNGYERFDVSSVDSGIKVGTERTFATPDPGADGAQLAAPDQDDSPLESAASPEQFEAILADIHGPTDDASAQLQRLGPFPNLPTPLEAEILNVKSSLSVADEAGLVLVDGSVEMAVAGEFDEVNTFFQAQVVAAGWELTRTEDRSDTEAAEVKHSYTSPDVLDSVGAPLSIEVVDEPANARVQVIIEYNEFLPEAQGDWDRWSGWAGDAPIPDGGELVSMSVSSFRWQGDAASLVAVHAFPNLERDDVLPAVEAVSGSGDYTRNPDLDRTGFGDLDYTHAYFTRVGANVWTWGSTPAVLFEAQFPFGE